MRRSVLVVGMFVLGLMALSTEAQAQTVCTVSPCTVRVGQAFSVRVDHDGLNLTNGGFRLYDGTAVVATQTPAGLVSGVVTFARPAPTVVGTHVFQVASYNDGGEARSTTITVSVVVNAPSAPTNIRITLP